MLNAVYGSVNAKAAARAATSANVNLAANVSVSQDGVTLVAGDRLLVMFQTAGAENGIYVVGTVATGAAPLTRAEDFSQGDQVVDALIPVSQGSRWGNRVFKVQGLSATPTIGTTALSIIELGYAAQGIVATTDATVTTLCSDTPPDQKETLYSAYVSAIKDDYSAGASYVVHMAVRRSGGTVTLVGSSTAQALVKEDDASFDCDMDISSTTVRVRVTGKAATNLTWCGKLERVAVS